MHPILSQIPLFNTCKPIVVAGPCSAESREQTIATAKELRSLGVKFFRAGLWKPRTKPGGFEGVGKEGISWLREVKEQTGMKVSTEVANAWHVRAALRGGIDMLWIGARTTANPFAVQDIADALQHSLLKGIVTVENLVVLVKNPVNPDPELWRGAMERISNAGVKQIAAVHRGFSTYEKGLFRNLPHWHIPIELKRRDPNLIMLCDPSHIGGKPSLIYPISQQALDMGFDGLMIESHVDPPSALSDSEQQITPSRLKEILMALVVRESIDCSESLFELRREIDELDERLLELLSKRMSISREIGRYKKDNNIPVLQPLRYDKMVTGRILQASELGLDSNFVKSILEAIHEESVRQQVQITSETSNYPPLTK